MQEILTVICTGLVGYVVWILQQQFSSKSATSRAMKILLRSEIYSQHARYMERGNISAMELHELTEIYKIYTEDFKGNGTATRMMKDIEKLPLRED